jgi:hypothetical protein
MPVFVQLMSSFSTSGKLAEEDTESVNIMLKKLQDDCAKILDVKLSIGSQEHIVSLVYIIMYEVKDPVKI